MLHSSLGFHTMTLFLSLDKKDVQKLFKDFKKYSKDTGLIQIYPPDDNTKKFRVNYPNEDRGIEWMIWFNNWSRDFKSYIVEVKINPKILGGIHDYLTAATYDDMEAAITNFNLESKRISRILGDFSCYRLKRIDYCINFHLDELIPGCSPEQIMKLIKRANIPPHYEEWTEYNDTSHRWKSRPSSFYLINNSANINCYSKYMELLERSQDRESKGLSPIPQITLDNAQNIVRFEVQCKYLKTYVLNYKAEKAGNHKYNKYENVLNHTACLNAVSYYYKKTIGKGDWYTLQDAIHIIHSKHFNRQKEKRLIEALAQVNQCRSLYKAKSAYADDDLKAFKNTLSDLSSLGINPVTIPKDWGIKHLPNLLYTYLDKLEMEESKKETGDSFYNYF